jgi:hypothetical protein
MALSDEVMKVVDPIIKPILMDIAICYGIIILLLLVILIMNAFMLYKMSNATPV